jgi:predicted RNase H-like nuclease
MRFLGVDLGWRGKPSGLADWDGAGALDLARLTAEAEILDWIDTRAPGPAMIAVDAPLVIPNATGMRVPDRLTHVHFGRYDAGCYPANRGLPFAERVTRFSEELRRRGFRHADRITAGKPGRYQIEVYPHAAAVNLFGLPRILKYKKGPVAVRVAEMRRYRRLLAARIPARLPAVPPGGAALKAAEDLLDAALCAYIGWHWWMHGRARSVVLGARRDGYIVVPRAAS